MDWNKIAPWNWFKEEEPAPPAAQIPARLEGSPDPFSALRMEIDRLLDGGFRRPISSGLFSQSVGAVAAPLRPNVDISEGKKAYAVRAELPGVEQEDVSLEIEGHTLLIRAEKRQDREEEDEGYHWVERSYGAVQRVLSLPDDADVETIEARFKNGILKLRIPKLAARAAQGRNIQIERG